MQLIAIRHARPVRAAAQANEVADPLLSDEGVRQAAALARWLAREPIHRIYSSPLQRARQTAAPLAEQLRLPVEVEPRIAELERDPQMYVPLEELRESDYAAWQEFVRDGYPEGETLERFKRDVVSGMEDIIRTNPGKHVAVICHGGVINAWAGHVLQIQASLFFGPQYTSVNRFSAARSGERSVTSLNETAHLRER